MSGGDLIVIFHFDGDFEFDMIHPLYKGGKQKMRFINSNITFKNLINMALEASNWEETSDNISMDFLHHNGRVFSLVTIEDDNDIRCMLSPSRDDTNGIYLYIRRRRLVRSAERLEKQARNRAMDILINQAGIEFEGDVNQFERRDPNQTGHRRLLDELGGRVTDIAPLHFLWEKNLTTSDVSSQQARFVFRRNILEDNIVRCLTSQQRDDLCNNREQIQVAGFDEGGRQWALRLLKRKQESNANGTYVLIGDWASMARENGWSAGVVIKIWGLPYGGREDQWRFGPDHDFSYITFVFITTV